MTPQTGANDAQYSLYSPNPANKIQGYNFSIAYQDGARATGDVYRDFIAVDGLSYPSQSIQAATNVSPGLLQEPGLDGFLGLGFSSQNTGEQQPSFQGIRSDDFEVESAPLILYSETCAAKYFL